MGASWSHLSKQDDYPAAGDCRRGSHRATGSHPPLHAALSSEESGGGDTGVLRVSAEHHRRWAGIGGEAGKEEEQGSVSSDVIDHEIRTIQSGVGFRNVCATGTATGVHG